MTESQYQELAQRTLDAQKANREIPMITKEYPELTRAEGYHIQALREQLVLAEGHQLVGYKMGATSLAKRRQMGSKMPSYGRLFEHYQLPEGRFELDHFIHPKLESEITFVLGKELKGPFVSVPDVLCATKYIVPSFEIIDSRYENFKFTGPDVVSDNISASGFALGSRRVDPYRLDLTQIGATLYINGEDMAYGTGAEILGHPARAVAELANLLWEQERRTLEPGMIVMTGSITVAMQIQRGQRIKTAFSKLGSVEIEVV